ncbi:DeoR/GlpR family DNA-binding transcription regulator [Floccifex sp.]|uniref:DeoR/GlpR family DNA-binding transcription regulator n=1 Tax=Floccifex sp. TaxID=2815810 RepID=UPI003F0195EE
MLASERFSIIVQIVNKRKFISTKELATQLNVTETTIRRDCEELEKNGLIIRVHGGAKSIKTGNVLTNQQEKRMSERGHLSQKDKVAKKASELVKDGDCVFLDGGTSIVPMVKYIKDKHIKIVTHSNLILDEYIENSNAEIFVIGGKYIPAYNMSVGPITLHNLEQFNFDYAFVSCAGLDLERKLVYTVEMETMDVKRMAMKLALKSYLLVDSSKLDVKGFCSFINTDDFDAIICDEIKDKEILDNMIVIQENE